MKLFSRKICEILGNRLFTMKFLSCLISFNCMYNYQKRSTILSVDIYKMI